MTLHLSHIGILARSKHVNLSVFACFFAVARALEVVREKKLPRHES